VVEKSYVYIQRVCAFSLDEKNDEQTMPMLAVQKDTKNIS
jgi:hypothetical protein